MPSYYLGQVDSASPALDALVNSLRVKPMTDQGPDLQTFVGAPSEPTGLAVTYGGHFLGQAVAAAQATVAADRQLHSLHASFLRGGEHGEPIYYDVERVRDGRSYVSRRVRAWQQQGRYCFELAASFAVDEPGQTGAMMLPRSMPPQDPESLATYRDLMNQLGEEERLPPPAEWSRRELPIDIRPVNATWHPDGLGADGSINQWIRAAAPLPNDPALHIAALAFQSDESLADVVVAPFGLSWGDEKSTVASLDHALWVHRPVDLNQWIYVEQFPETVYSERGLARARMWNPAGHLVASATQEVLVRVAG